MSGTVILASSTHRKEKVRCSVQNGDIEGRRQGKIIQMVQAISGQCEELVAKSGAFSEFQRLPAHTRPMRVP